MGMKACTANNACALCFVHREHRSEYSANFDDFSKIQDLFNSPEFARWFYDSEAALDAATLAHLEGVMKNMLAASIASAATAVQEGKKRKREAEAATSSFAKTLGQGKAPLLLFKAADIVFDELHSMLRIMDRLLNSLIRSCQDDAKKMEKLQSCLKSCTNIKSLQLAEDTLAKGILVFFASLIVSMIYSVFTE